MSHDTARNPNGYTNSENHASIQESWTQQCAQETGVALIQFTARPAFGEFDRVPQCSTKGKGNH